MFHVGIDVGGTFTDAILIDKDGRAWQSKVPTNAPDPSISFFQALEACMNKAGLDQDAQRGSARIVHGTTVATNAVVQRSGAVVGLLTTRGFGDTIHIMQGRGYIAGLSDDAVTNFQETTKPEPIVPKRLVREVHERADSSGQVVVPLNKEHAATVIQELLDAGVTAFAVSLLWSFVHPGHEEELIALIEDKAPGVFRCASSDVAPVMGEYARTNATVINAYVGPKSDAYLAEIGKGLSTRGMDATLSILQCTGGAVSIDEARRSPVRLIGSGPVGGTMACRNAAMQSDQPNVLAVDMGGTTFDVSLVVGGVPVATSASVVHQFEYSVPTIDVQSIGSGGGSIVWVEPRSGSLRVGPHSAGSQPGPACYARGGELPTITDCDLIVGYLNPEGFLGGELRLDRERAEAALTKHVAEPLGISLLEAARGALTIVDFQMAELMRQVTVGRGYDPRDFVVFAYGGGGPTHAPVFARELGARQVVIPRGAMSAVWSAFGAVSSDALVALERSFSRTAPFVADELEGAFLALENDARQRLIAFGVDPATIQTRRSADLKYGAQAHVVDVDIDPQVTAVVAATIPERLLQRYESIFGPDTAYQDATVRMTALRVQALAPDPSSILDRLAPPIPAQAEQREELRPVCWSAADGLVDTPVLNGEALAPGTVIPGPAIIELSVTTIPVHTGQSVTVSANGDFVLGFHEAERKDAS